MGAAKDPKGKAAAPGPSGEVSLARYAAVKAAVAEGFPLEDVLATEGLKPRAFARADVVWKQRLAGDPELLAAYEAEVAEAEDWLDRRVEPLAEDAAAWASFLAVFEAQAEPFAFLQAKGLGMNDVSRLRRRWARRAEKEARIGEQLAKLREKPGELGPLRLGPLVLRPSREAQASLPARETPVAPAAAAALQGTAPVLELPRGPALPFGPALGEPALQRSEPKAPRAAESLTGTGPTLDIPRGPELPFPDAKKPEVKRPPSALVETSLQLDIPRGPALPFAKPAASRPAAGPPPPPGPAVVRAPAALQGTAPVLEVPRGPVLPFAGATEGAANGGAAGQAAADPLESALPLARYASLCAELSLFPQVAEAIFRRYGLETEEQRMAIDAAWKERLRQDPKHYDAWKVMYQRYHARFAKRGAPTE